jgi:hypothetical protein
MTANFLCAHTGTKMLDAVPPTKPVVNGVVLSKSPRSPESDRLSMVAPQHREIARWLLEHEMRISAANNDALSAAFEQVCQMFFIRLARVTSPPACQAMLARALHIPRTDFAFLDGVRAASTPDHPFEGLRTCLEGVDSLGARTGLEAVLGTLIDLLASHIGQDLTLRMCLEVWPDLPVGQDSVPPPRTGGITP